ncbi:hypothetical protein SCANM63S_00874 [Streptomyces canarius]
MTLWAFRMRWLRRPTRAEGFAVGRAPARGAWRRVPGRVLAPVVLLAAVIGYYVPFFGLPLLLFVLVDVAVAASAAPGGGAGVIAATGLRWILTLLFAVSVVHGVWRAALPGTRAADRVDHTLHAAMGVLMTAMAPAWGMDLSAAPQVVLFSAGALWFVVAALLHPRADSSRIAVVLAAAPHVVMTAAMAWMVAAMDVTAITADGPNGTYGARLPGARTLGGDRARDPRRVRDRPPGNPRPLPRPGHPPSANGSRDRAVPGRGRSVGRTVSPYRPTYWAASPAARRPLGRPTWRPCAGRRRRAGG